MRAYLDVCNAATEEHRHSLAYRPIIAAYDGVFANRQIGDHLKLGRRYMEDVVAHRDDYIRLGLGQERDGDRTPSRA